MADNGTYVSSILQAAGKLHEMVERSSAAMLTDGDLHNELLHIDNHLWELIWLLEEEGMDVTERHPPRPPKIIDVELPDA